MRLGDVRVGMRVRVIRDLTAEYLEQEYGRKVERAWVGELGTIVELGDETYPTGGLDEDDAGRPMADVQLDSGKAIAFYLDEVEPTEAQRP